MTDLKIVAVVRVRGNIKVQRKTKDTLKMLNLKYVNNCVVFPLNMHYKGMLQKVKDYVTWGELKKEVFEKMLMKWGRTVCEKKISADYLREKKISVDELYEGKKKLKAVEIKPVFRLHPPRGGYEGIKRPFKMKGTLGYRGEEINELLERMV